LGTAAVLALLASGPASFASAQEQDTAKASETKISSSSARDEKSLEAVDSERNVQPIVDTESAGAAQPVKSETIPDAATTEKANSDGRSLDHQADDPAATASVTREPPIAPAQNETIHSTIAAEKAAPVGAEQTEPAVQTATKPALPDLIQAALEKLMVSEAKSPRAAETQKIHEALAAFYTMQDFKPLWTANGQPTPAAKTIIDRLSRAPDDGLDLVSVPDLQARSDDDQVKADIALSEAVMSYGLEASGNRVDPKAISPLIGEKPAVADPFAILSSVYSAGEGAGDALLNFNPPQKGYQALREKLAEMRREKTPIARQPIPSGPELTVGMRDPRVTLIRARFGLDVQQAPTSEELVYDTRVAAAVADFQKTNGLPASGVLTARTIAALSGGQPSRLENEILANMERWRWMPRDMGETYIAVNVPDFTVSVIKDDQVLTRHRVVVGKPDTPTPIFSNKMQYLIVNPYWNVPQSIIRKEFLPKAGGDLSYLSEQGWQVSSSHGQLTVRQPPGEKNALGRIKFLFPNDYSVYLHDTPSRALFASTKRAFSHGCVRVDQPFSFAESVLNHSWSEQRLKSLIGSSERYINLPVPLPIHIEYFTTYVDEAGHLQLRDDLYGYSHKVKAALGLER
jgi:murein L,D-transpeptidase YcbB/YkuD